METAFEGNFKVFFLADTVGFFYHTFTQPHPSCQLLNIYFSYSSTCCSLNFPISWCLNTSCLLTGDSSSRLSVFSRQSAFLSVSPNHGHGPSIQTTAHLRKQKHPVSLNWRLSREDAILNKEKMLCFSLHLSTVKECQAFFVLGSATRKALDFLKNKITIVLILGGYALKRWFFSIFFKNQLPFAVAPDKGKLENAWFYCKTEGALS